MNEGISACSRFLTVEVSYMRVSTVNEEEAIFLGIWGVFCNYFFSLLFLVDSDFSLANPTLSKKEVPQPDLFSGKLKSYQLKGMNWLANLYEQVGTENFISKHNFLLGARFSAIFNLFC